MEGINAIETGRLISISEQELLDCAVNLGCSGGGWVPNAYDWVIASGIASEASYPYTAVKGTCRASQVSFLLTTFIENEKMFFFEQSNIFLVSIKLVNFDFNLLRIFFI